MALNDHFYWRTVRHAAAACVNDITLLPAAASHASAALRFTAGAGEYWFPACYRYRWVAAAWRRTSRLPFR